MLSPSLVFSPLVACDTAALSSSLGFLTGPLGHRSFVLSLSLRWSVLSPFCRLLVFSAFGACVALCPLFPYPQTLEGVYELRRAPLLLSTHTRSPQDPRLGTHEPHRAQVSATHRLLTVLSAPRFPSTLVVPQAPPLELCPSPVLLTAIHRAVCPVPSCCSCPRGRPPGLSHRGPPGSSALLPPGLRLCPLHSCSCRRLPHGSSWRGQTVALFFSHCLYIFSKMPPPRWPRWHSVWSSSTRPPSPRSWLRLPLLSTPRHYVRLFLSCLSPLTRLLTPP